MKNTLFPLIGLGLGLGALSAPSAAQALVARYQLDEVSGTVCADSSGNGNNGTYRGAFTLGQPSAGGTCATAVNLDPSASSDVIIPGGPILQSLTSELTLSAWINPTNLPGPNGVQRIFGNNDGGWTCGITDDGLIFTTRFIQDYVLSNIPINTGTWTHVAFAFDANFTVTFYVDGANVGALTGGAPALSPNPDWFIGGFNGAIEFWDGLVDDIQIYGEVLSAGQIAGLAMSPCSTITLGTNYCMAAPNVTGVPGVMSASGTSVVSQNDLTLTASSLPINQFGIFLVSRTQAFIPGANGTSNGNICLGGAIGRFVRAGQILATGSTGEFDLQVDLTAIPQATGTVVTMPGDVWNFQAWHRSPVGLGSNFSDGISIAFN